MPHLIGSAGAILLATLLAAWPAAAPAAPTGPATAGADRPLILAIIPNAPPVAMHKRWTPFVERLSSLASVHIELKLYEDMATFEKDYQSGLPDLLFAHPSMTADAHRRQGFVPLVRDSTEIYGILFVRKDSPYRTITDLLGKRIAFVGARSFCAVITKDMMASVQANLDFEEQNTGSTRNVLKAVMLGKADAGASLDVSVLAEPADLVSEVRPLATSRGMAPHPLSAHPRLAADLRGRIAAAVLSMRTSPSDRALLAAVRLTEPVAADYDRDYRALERTASAR